MEYFSTWYSVYLCCKHGAECTLLACKEVLFGLYARPFLHTLCDEKSSTEILMQGREKLEEKYISITFKGGVYWRSALHIK